MQPRAFTHTNTRTHPHTHTRTHRHTHTLTKLKDHAKPNVDHVFINQIAAIMCTYKTIAAHSYIDGIARVSDPRYRGP